MISHDDIREYVETRKSTLWGQAFNVHMPDTREKAIVWLSSVVDELQVIENNRHYEWVESLDG